MVNKSTLDNGIRVVTEKIPSAHSITIGLWVENGSRHEQPSQNGISHFIEHLLFKGTERRSAQAIAKEIDSVGGALNAFTTREYSCYYAKVLAKKLPLAIDLLSDIVLNSVFELDEIEKERRVILQEIHKVEDDPDDLIQDLFCQKFWVDHPLGLSILGSEETVSNITRASILAFMAERYCGRNIIICAAGDLDHQELVDRIAEAFKQVPAGTSTPVCTLPEYHRGVNVTGKDLEQVHICLGTRGLPQDHPDRFIAYTLNSILGGSLSSRLFQNVREDLGLVYSIYSYLNSHTDAGALVIASGTSFGDASRVVGILLKELNKLRTDLVEEEELYSTKEQLKGNLMLSMESTDNRMTRLARNEIYLGCHFPLKDALRAVDRVSREEILKLGQLIFCDDYLNLQLVGRVKRADFPLLDLTLG